MKDVIMEDFFLSQKHLEKGWQERRGEFVLRSIDLYYKY